MTLEHDEGGAAQRLDGVETVSAGNGEARTDDLTHLRRQVLGQALDLKVGHGHSRGKVVII